MTDFPGATKSSVAGPASQAAQDPAEGAALAAAQADDAVVRRTKDGWRVGGADVPDLTSAMVLADLISAELASDEEGSPASAVAKSLRLRQAKNEGI